MSRLAFVVAAVVVAAHAGCPGAQTKDQGRVEGPPLEGGWASACFAMQNPDGTDGFGKLEFDMHTSTWAVDLTFFGDDACGAKLGTVHIDGPYTIQAPSTTLPGAFDARFDFGARSVTPHVDGFIAFLQSMSCGSSPYVVGKPQDILEQGCPAMGFQAKAACPSDFDVVFVSGTTLQFGQRPADNNMCSADRRPRALGAPLTRVR